MNIKDPVWHDSYDPWSQDSESDSFGYVYVIQDLDSGLFNNYTKNPYRRFDELGVRSSAQEISCDYFKNARQV
tara:strand:+ start:209 stop:427 length:219 start_codon:yes stop_codon:yes gene_type:complete